MDIGFLVDSSNTANWAQSISFIKNLLTRFYIHQDGTHVGFMTYSESPSIGFLFNALTGKAYTRDGVNSLIDRVVRPHGATRQLDRALLMTARQLFSAAGGARPNARKVRNIQNLKLKKVNNSNDIFYLYIRRSNFILFPYLLKLFVFRVTQILDIKICVNI